MEKTFSEDILDITTHSYIGKQNNFKCHLWYEDEDDKYKIGLAIRNKASDQLHIVLTKRDAQVLSDLLKQYVEQIPRLYED